MSPLRTAPLLTAVLLAPVLAAGLLVSGGASAAPPAAQASAAPAVARVTDASDGSTVRVVPGQLLRVELAAAAERWQGLERSTPQLQVVGYGADENGLAVSLRALAPGGPQLLRATAGERVWSVQVVVEQGEPQAPRTCATPAPTAQPSATAAPTASATSSPAPPNGRALGPGDDGGRVTVRVDDPVNVQLDDCTAPYGPVTVSGPVRRDSASSSVPDGEAEADLVPTAPGTATLTAERDVPCAARGGASCPPPWSVVLDVQPAPCDVVLEGPAFRPAGSEAVLTGQTSAFETVEVLFRARGAAAFTVRRVLQADLAGRFSTSYTALDDHRWYARTARCSSAPGLTQVQPTVSGPAQVRRGAEARLVVRALPGSRVAVSFRRAMTSRFVTRRTGTAGPDGRFVTSFRPDVDHAYVASALGRTSAPGVTRAR